MSVRDSHDVIVVGSRVAGAITAALVAERGHRALLIDRSRHGVETQSVDDRDV